MKSKYYVISVSKIFFQTISKRSEIHDIPALRGHLRTMTMPQYEKFQQFMLNLIK